MFLGTTRNAAGTVVHNYRCDSCPTSFTVTGIPQVVNRPCRLPGCPSYDAELDIDLALSKGDISIRGRDGKTIVMRKQPLDPDRKEFLQRTGNRNHPLVIIRRLAPSAPATDDPTEVNVVAATCRSCSDVREFKLEAPLRSAEEIKTWLRTKLTACRCGGSEADIAMRLDKVEALAN